MVVKIQVILWVVTPCSIMVGYHPKDTGSKVLQNTAVLLQHYMASQCTKVLM